MTLGRCSLSIICSRGTPPTVCDECKIVDPVSFESVTMVLPKSNGEALQAGRVQFQGAWRFAQLEGIWRFVQFEEIWRFAQFEGVWRLVRLKGVCRFVQFQGVLIFVIWRGLTIWSPGQIWSRGQTHSRAVSVWKHQPSRRRPNRWFFRLVGCYKVTRSHEGGGASLP